jgi:hypothetical protein
VLVLFAPAAHESALDNHNKEFGKHEQSSGAGNIHRQSIKREKRKQLLIAASTATVW